MVDILYRIIQFDVLDNDDLEDIVLNMPTVTAVTDISIVEVDAIPAQDGSGNQTISRRYQATIGYTAGASNGQIEIRMTKITTDKSTTSVEHRNDQERRRVNILPITAAPFTNINGTVQYNLFVPSYGDGSNQALTVASLRKTIDDTDEINLVIATDAADVNSLFGNTAVNVNDSGVQSTYDVIVVYIQT